MAYRLVPTQEPIPALGTNPSDEDMRRYLIDQNRVLHDWYKEYQESVNRALNLPSFRVHRNGTDQTAIADITLTKISFNSIATSSGIDGWDSHKYFDLTTNYRYTPKIPGVYHFGLQAKFKLVSGTNVELLSSIYLNGVAVARGSENSATSAVSPSIPVTTTIRMNGRTDYVEFYAYQGSGGAQDLNGSAISTFAYGYKVSDLPT